MIVVLSCGNIWASLNYIAFIMDRLGAMMMVYWNRLRFSRVSLVVVVLVAEFSSGLSACYMGLSVCLFLWNFVGPRGLVQATMWTTSRSNSKTYGRGASEYDGIQHGSACSGLDDGDGHVEMETGVHVGVVRPMRGRFSYAEPLGEEGLAEFHLLTSCVLFVVQGNS
jgi:hypothetical protein